MKRAILIAIAIVSGVLLASSSGQAFDADTTHAGLTERALFASSLKLGLGARLGWGAEHALGIFEPLRLAGRDARTSALLERLARLDPASGVRPEAGRLTALGWLVAGSVVEEVPPLRARNHFFDPTTGTGLAVRELSPRLRTSLSLPGGGFDGTGVPSTSWLTAPDNDLALVRFVDARERSLAAATPAERDSAAAEALLVAGALLHVVEDAALPAYVHNDLLVDLLDGGAPFVAFVAARYGRSALPPPAGPARPLAHLADAIHNAERSGLADRTAAAFYSLGLLAAQHEGVTAPSELPAPVAGSAAEGYLEDAAHRRVAHFTRDARGVPHWDLDAHCYQDAAAVLLPQAGQAALSALEHLFRGGLSIHGGGDADAATVQNGIVPLGAGRLRVLVEDGAGKRTEALARDVSAAAAGATLVELPATEAGNRVIAVFRGVDGSGEPIVVGEAAAR